MISTIGTHNGKFHTDEVSGVAVLLTLFPEAAVIRTRDQAILDTLDLVLDVGGEYDHEKLRYDHHQPGGADIYANGIKYSSIGLIWRHYGHDFIQKVCEVVLTADESQEVWRRVSERLVMSFDADDNGQATYEQTSFGVSPVKLGDAINWLNFSDVGAPAQEIRFKRAVGLMTELLILRVNYVAGAVKSEAIVQEAYNRTPDPRYLILDQYHPVGELAEKLNELLYVAFPDSNGKDWVAKSVPLSRNSFNFRKPPPESWRSLSGKDLELMSTVTGAKFCHASGMVFGSYTREGIEKMLELAADA